MDTTTIVAGACVAGVVALLGLLIKNRVKLQHIAHLIGHVEDLLNEIIKSTEDGKIDPEEHTKILIKAKTVLRAVIDLIWKPSKE